MNTVHYIFASNKDKFTNIYYSSVISALKFFKRVIIHEDGQGDTSYYRAIRKLPNIYFQKITLPSKEHQLAIEKIRFQILYDEGGVFADFQTIFLRPVPTDPFICYQYIPSTHLNHCVVGVNPKMPYIHRILEKILPVETFEQKLFWKNLISTEECLNSGISVLHTNLCFPYSKTDKEFLSGKTIDLSDNISVHLWQFKKNMTNDDFRKSIISKYLSDLPKLNILEESVVSFN